MEPNPGRMAIEQTLLICQVDAVERGLVGEIIARFERRGFVLVGLKMLRVTEQLARGHFAEHEGKPFYETLIADTLAGPLVAMVVSGEEAVAAARQTIGDRNPRKALPGTIRADFAQTIRNNLMHASNSAESARREIAVWFTKDELQPRENPLVRQLRGDD